MGQSVEIEKLLQWAFRSELPKCESAGPRTAQSAWLSVEGYARLGCRVDVSPVLRSAIPHRDALVIADQVAGLRGHLRIDFNQWGQFLLGDLLPLAQGIESPQLGVSEVDLVETHARAGVSPDWCRLPPKAGAVIERNGKPRVCGKRYGKDRYSEGAHCPLLWVDLTRIARLRAEYTVWRGSLDRLAKSLDGKLKHFSPSPPAALPAPWMRPH